MKALHLPDGVGMCHLSRALRKQGVYSRACSFYTKLYSYLADDHLKLEELDPKERNKKVMEYFKKAKKKYDVFHFHFGLTFFPDFRDLKMLRNSKKKLIAHHRGSEVRKLSVARSFNNPYVQVKSYWTEDRIHQHLQSLSKYIDQAIVADHELLQYVKPYYKQAHVVPNIVDTNKIKPRYPTSTEIPLVVHAPSNRDVKGTSYILQAVDQLKREGMKFDFKLIENMAHKKALQLYQQSSIVIDQILIGSYGNLSMEAMAMGKPVICYIREDLRKHYPAELPIVSANPDTIYETLKELLNQQSQWKKIGLAGRNYVKKHHNSKMIAKMVKNIYKNL